MWVPSRRLYLSSPISLLADASVLYTPPDLLSFVIAGNPNTLFAGQNTTSWPLYNGNPTDQVVSFDETGFSVIGDELDCDQVREPSHSLSISTQRC